MESGAKEAGDYNRMPLFGDSDETVSVDENTASGEAIGDPITANDPDGDDLTYSLTGTYAASFSIDSSTGQISTGDPLDHETMDTYHLAVSVRDGKDIDGNSDTVEDDSIGVTINVNDVNEAPVFAEDAPTTLNVVENTPADENIGEPITATDQDNGDTVTYDLDDNDGAAFEIDTNTGQIKTKASLMDESQGTYNVTVTASDDNNNEATHEVTITVIDANDPPVFSDVIPEGETSITRSVVENTVAGQPVGEPVAATDEENDTLTYSLDDQGGTNFDIDETSGQIKTKTVFDYETDTKSYSVTVSVHDGKDINGNAEDPPEEDANIEVTINVTDVNEGPHFRGQCPHNAGGCGEHRQQTPISSAAPTRPLTRIRPTIPLTYSLGGTDAASFDIDTATGQLKTKAALDHEDKGSYSVDVQVSDGKDAAGTAEDHAGGGYQSLRLLSPLQTWMRTGRSRFLADPPSAGTALTATLADEDSGVTCRDLGVGNLRRPEHLDSYLRCGYQDLHAGLRRHRQIPTSYGHLHRLV